jgi:hypothetical protein
MTKTFRRFKSHGTQNYLAVSNHFPVFFRRNTLRGSVCSQGRPRMARLAARFSEMEHRLLLLPKPKSVAWMFADQVFIRAYP